MCGMTFASRKSGHGVFCRASGVVVLGMLVGAVLTWLPLRTLAAEPDPADEEFVAFLEYLGSWDGNEEDWVQFLDAGNSDSSRTAEGRTAEGMSAADDAKPTSSTEQRARDPDLQLATAGN